MFERNISRDTGTRQLAMTLGISSYVWGALVLLAGYRGHVYVALSMVALYGLVVLLDRILLDATTASLDLSYIGLERKNGKFNGTALVAGGSMAGMLTAKVLSAHFERVIVVDDEVQQASLVRRPHVGQHSRLHVLSAFSTDVVERMFPQLDIPAEIKALGGRMNLMRDVENLSLDGGRLKFAQDLPIRLIVLCRPTLETWIRKQVLGVPNIELVWGRVTGLEVDQDQKNRIAEVDVSRLDGLKSKVPVALVVDCTGAASVGQKWLKRLDYQGPRTTSYNPHLPYIDVKCFLNQEEWDQLQGPPQIPKEKLGAISMSVGTPFLEKKGLAIVLRCDPGIGDPGDVAMIHVVYALREEYGPLPETPAELLEAFRQHTDIGDYTIALMEKLVQFPRWTKMDKVTVERCARVHYDELSALPANFVAVGDSCSRLNPTFGQGITQSMRMAVTLNAALYHCPGEKLPDDFSRRYFAKAMKRCDAFIDNNKLRDAMWSSFEAGEGETTPDTDGLLPRFLAKLMHATHHDTACAALFMHIINGVVSPLELVSPETLIRIWWASYMFPGPVLSKEHSGAA